MDNGVKLCPYCGGEIDKEATRCIHCKKWFDKKPRKFLETVLMCWFLGAYGIHRFYTGYYLIGIIQLFTFGGLGIWSTIDFISMCLGSFKDAYNQELDRYTTKLGYGILIGWLMFWLLGLLLVVGAIMLAIFLSVKGS